MHFSFVYQIGQLFDFMSWSQAVSSIFDGNKIETSVYCRFTEAMLRTLRQGFLFSSIPHAEQSFSTRGVRDAAPSCHKHPRFKDGFSIEV